MRIYLIRHGQTTGDVEDRYGGDYDDHLTEKGIIQSKTLAEKLKNNGIRIIYHSPRIRATETAQIVGDTLEVKLQAVPDFRERNNYGILTGMKKSEAKNEYPIEVKKLQQDKLRHGIEGSEDYESFKERILNAFETILMNIKYETIAIITHGGPISIIVREELKLECEDLADCAILELESKNNKVSLVGVDGVELEKK